MSIETSDLSELEQAESLQHKFHRRTGALKDLQRLCNQFPTPETEKMRKALSRILERVNAGGKKLVISLCGALGSGQYQGGDIDIGLFSGTMSRDEAKKILKDGLRKEYGRVHVDFWEPFLPLDELEFIGSKLSKGYHHGNRYIFNILARFIYTNALSGERLGCDISPIIRAIQYAIDNGQIPPDILDLCLKKIRIKMPRYYGSFTKYLERIKRNPEFKKKNPSEQKEVFQNFQAFCQIIFNKKFDR